MFNFLTKGIVKIFGGTKSEKDVKEARPLVDKTNAEFAKLRDLSNDEFRTKTPELQAYIQDKLAHIDTKIKELLGSIEQNPDMGVDEKETIFKQVDTLKLDRNKELEVVLQEILPKAFAIVKETARRFKNSESLTVTATHLDRELAMRKKHIAIEGDKATWNSTWEAAGNPIKWDMEHYDVQIIGGANLHSGKISEMATGEGKTLVATFPAFLNALAGNGVHIVTVNDYLARRDSEWMGPIFEFNGITCDCIDKYPANSAMRRQAYQAGITYGTNNEFGFDYLRDNMVDDQAQLVQREHHYAMVDEVDSVLVDDARTPLIISGPTTRTGDEELYLSLKPRIQRIVEAQKVLINNYLLEAKKSIGAGNKKDGGMALFRAFRGLPKNKPLIKYLSEPGIRQVLQETEAIHLAENQKLMPEADAPLYFTIDERHNSIEMTDKGLDFITGEGEDHSFFVMPDLGVELAAIEKSDLGEQDKIVKKDEIIRDYSMKAERIHAINQLLKAFTLFEKDVEYVVMDNKVMIVDEQTGRIMDGRRWSDGLHQAVEAKENVKVEDSTQTYATITLQNYFRMYHKLAGMTGTAETEAGEFMKIYKLDVVSIPTNRDIIRKDQQDKVYKTVREKYNAVIDEINELVNIGRPVLVGTTSVENSEILSRMLTLRKIQHQVLNAKQHAREADVVAEAGKPGTVTIATNMAGRGTDIKLTPESRAAGGLAIIGTERHESRRVDRQLRGRAGRQGDPGTSQFFVSLEDQLMRLFGSDRIAKVMDRMGMEEGEVIQHSMITNSIERAQKKVEENNFGMRKRLIEYDDVMNIQRDTIYKRRKNALFGDRLALDIANITYDVAADIVSNAGNNYDEFELRCIQKLAFQPSISREDFAKINKTKLVEALYHEAEKQYQEKNKRIRENVMNVLSQLKRDRGVLPEELFLTLISDGIHEQQIFCNINQTIQTEGRELIKEMEKGISLGLIDQEWKEHLRDMDDLKTSVQNASYEQKDPLLIYKFEAVELFKNFLNKVNTDTVSFLMKADVVNFGFQQVAQPVRKEEPKLSTNKTEEGGDGGRMPMSPAHHQKIADRNQRVSVQYKDGTVKRDVKYKHVEDDVIAGKAVLVG
jgi:preprotein translocase subunit SecA